MRKLKPPERHRTQNRRRQRLLQSGRRCTMRGSAMQLKRSSDKQS